MQTYSTGQIEAQEIIDSERLLISYIRTIVNYIVQLIITNTYLQWGP